MRKRYVGPALATGLVMGGFAFEGEAVSPSAVDISAIEQLPPQVEDAFAGVGSLRTDNVTYSGVNAFGKRYVSSSGKEFSSFIKVGGTLAVGAGHSGMSEMGKDNEYNCANQTATMQTEQGYADAAVTAAAGEYTEESDWSVFQMAANNPDFQAVPAVSLQRKSLLTVGDQVWFANYQTDKQAGTVRTPEAQDRTTPDERETSLDYSQQARFTGKVIVRDGSLALVMTDIGPSLGKGAPATFLESGGSGGMVISDKGFEGVSVSTRRNSFDKRRFTYRPHEIEKKFGLALKGANPGHEYQLTNVQLLTKRFVAERLNRMKPCGDRSKRALVG